MIFTSVFDLGFRWCSSVAARRVASGGRRFHGPVGSSCRGRVLALAPDQPDRGVQDLVAQRLGFGVGQGLIQARQP